MSARSDAVATLWKAMVERAEELNDAVAAGQRRADARVADRIAILAQEIETLAAVARLLRRPMGNRR